MDGRVSRWLILGLAAITVPNVGCRLFQTQPDPNLPPAVSTNGLQQAGHTQPSTGISNWFSKKPAYGPIPEQVPVRTATGKKEWKPETFSAFADAELEMAYDSSLHPELDRDALIDVARRKFEAALQKDPKNKTALLGLGKLYTWAGDRDRSAKSYQTALLAHPKDKDVCWAVVRSNVRFEDWNGAAKACDMALALEPQNRTYMKAKGYCLARADQWDKAFDALLNVMTESEARTFLARTLIDLGRTQDGQAHLKLAVECDPHNEVAGGLLAQLNEAAVPGPAPLQQAGHQK